MTRTDQPRIDASPFNQSQNIGRLGSQRSAGFGRLYSAGFAQQQGGADNLFKLLDLAGKRGLRDVEFFGRSTKTAVAHNRHEVAQMPQINPAGKVGHGVPPPGPDYLKRITSRINRYWKVTIAWGNHPLNWVGA